jgi:hypothetical protein
MKNRQEKPYVAHIATLTKPKLIAEIGAVLLSTHAEEAGAEEKLAICIAEDDRRGGTSYPKAVKLFNEALGYREIAPRQFDIREPRD